jgi:hypothetical protein
MPAEGKEGKSQERNNEDACKKIIPERKGINKKAERAVGKNDFISCVKAGGEKIVKCIPVGRVEPRLNNRFQYGKCEQKKNERKTQKRKIFVKRFHDDCYSCTIFPYVLISLLPISPRKHQQQVSDKIPQHGYRRSDSFGKVEIHFHFSGKRPEYDTINEKACKRYPDKERVFFCDAGIVAVEGPHPVKVIIAGSGGVKSGSISKKRVNLNFFFQQKRNAEIQEQTGKSDCRELQEFGKKIACEQSGKNHANSKVKSTKIFWNRGRLFCD